MASGAARRVGWLVLLLVLVVELLAVAAAYAWGRWYAGLWLGLVAAVVVVLVWGLFASPKAPWARGVVRPLAKTLVFGAATAGLAVAGHPTLAAAFLVLVVVVHALAALPSVRALTR